MENNIISCVLEDACLKQNKSIISGPFGSNISSKFFTEKGVPVIRGNNLTVGKDKFIDSGFVFISEEKANLKFFWSIANTNLSKKFKFNPASPIYTFSLYVVGVIG